jgi:hypothetical protein
MSRLRCLAALIALVISFGARPARAGGQVTTCVVVQARAEERAALQKLVENEVDRHPTHKVAREPCDSHLSVELLELESERFLTGRTGGEVPQRVRVEGRGGRALAAAVDELLRIVLGNDPVVLDVPGERSFFGERIFELKNAGRNTLDVAALENMSLLSGRVSFAPGILVGFTREVDRWQIGVEASAAVPFSGHPGRLDLDAYARLGITALYFFSRDADTSAFGGLSLGFAYQRFTGPRGPGLGRGDAEYATGGPGVGFRGGVEFFRTTTLRADLYVDAYLPMFVANDQETETVNAWVPALTLGAAARF